MPNDNELIIHLSLDDKASKQLVSALGNVQKSSDTAGKVSAMSFAKIAAQAVIVTASVMKVVSVMKEAVNAAIAKEDAVNRLNYALKSQGTYTDELSQKFQDFAEELRKSTRYSDEAIMGVQKTLIQVGDVAPEALNRVTQAALDMSTVMGRDVQGSALLLSKAAQGNTSALKRLGITIDENIPKGERFAAVLAEVEKKFGGSAQNDVNSFGGQIAVLTNAWDDLLVSLGKFVTMNPGIISAIKVITESVNFWSEALNKLSSSGNMLGGTNKQLQFMYDQINQIDDKVSAIRKVYSVNGIWINPERQKEVNDLLVEQHRIMMAIGDVMKMPGANDPINDASNQLTKNPNKEEFDAVAQLEKDKQSAINETAKLEEFIGNKSLVDWTRVNNAKVKTLEETKARLLITDKQIMQGMTTALATLESALAQAGETNKGMAIAAKAIAIGRAMMNTWEGITLAYATYPWPYSMAIAGIIGAAGAIQVGNIAGVKFAEGTDTVPAMLSPGEMVFPRSMADAIRQGDISVSGRGGSSPTTNNYIDINIDQPTVSKESDIEYLTEEISRRLLREVERIR